MLVSVIVATFNCAGFVDETLDSVFRQTYQDIELVITDDCSTDNTIGIAKQWIEEHKDRFTHTIITGTQSNSGVTANYNAGLREATGEWVKCLDGDDMLTDSAIEINVNHCLKNRSHPVWYSHEQPFHNGTLGEINRSGIIQSSARKQMIYLLNHRLLGICTATNFIHRQSFLAQGGFDSRYPMYQDGSPFLQSLAEGKSVGIIDAVTLLKRENPNSLMHTANPTMVENIRDCHYYYCRYYLRYGMPLHFYNAFVTHWLGTHNTSRWHLKATGFLLRCFDPVNLYRKICSSPS